MHHGQWHGFSVHCMGTQNAVGHSRRRTRGHSRRGSRGTRDWRRSRGSASALGYVRRAARGGSARAVMNVDSLSWEAAELEVMRFMNPELELSGGSLTRGWPLVSLREASLTVAAYLAFVVLGSAAMRRLPAPAGPILTSLMATYNATQVVLCFYMAAEAIRQYWALGYRPTCNNELVLVPGQPFEPTGMSEVLWVFYVSKVRQVPRAGRCVQRCSGCSGSFTHSCCDCGYDGADS